MVLVGTPSVDISARKRLRVTSRMKTDEVPSVNTTMIRKIERNATMAKVERDYKGCIDKKALTGSCKMEQ